MFFGAVPVLINNKNNIEMYLFTVFCKVEVVINLNLNEFSWNRKCLKRERLPEFMNY